PCSAPKRIDRRSDSYCPKRELLLGGPSTFVPRPGGERSKSGLRDGAKGGRQLFGRESSILPIESCTKQAGAVQRGSQIYGSPPLLQISQLGVGQISRAKSACSDWAWPNRRRAAHGTFRYRLQSHAWWRLRCGSQSVRQAGAARGSRQNAG